MQKGMNKRAQEGVTLSTLLLMVLGAVVVIVIILGATGGLNYVFDIFNKAPQDLEKVTQSCLISAKGGLQASYCSEFKEASIGGSKQYINCQYPAVESNVVKEVEALKCTTSSHTQAGREYCMTLIKSGKADDSTTANDVICSKSISCKDDLKGSLVDKGAACPQQTEIARLKGFIESKDGKACCVSAQ